METLTEDLELAKTLMETLPYPWWIAGGWAIDLALDKVTREHTDVDICILREHTQAVLDHFRDWKVMVAIPGEHRLVPCYTTEDVNPPRYCLHLYKEDHFLEILLTDRDGTDVVFRKDRSITMPLTQFSRQHGSGLSFVAPEWQLLFKVKYLR
jgi:hypothetical protein